MSNVTHIIGTLRKQWGQPREATHRGQKCPFLLACSFAPEPAVELEKVPLSIPEDMHEFWRTTRSANLFKDLQYGQWGVEVLEPTQALSETSRQAAARPRDFVTSDFVVARFFGDSDLLVLVCDRQRPDFGSVIVALPIDKRSDWPVVARSFGKFLQKLAESQGDKYWEVR
jgi:hypothetical protein